eukprot:TRINITY_DN4097_c0_g1_i2.p1 TRINITY_DN4097_c0_g1~~TRINITY_DN4097_c0_g1_i2.p1  ORF type:complete len:536 (-),score=105.69 TRINITY_DN4097_c0_g1_i2:112-1719(-)
MLKHSPSQENLRSLNVTNTIKTTNTNYTTGGVKILGNYDVGQTIGKGQFGKVKIARHVLTQNKVAIKFINKTLLDEASMKMIRREISIMKLLNHPYIIQLYEIIETEKFFYLVMEYASKGEVLEYIEKNGPFSEQQAVKYFYQILIALQLLHAHRIVHRDLKTENLLFDSKQNIKIIDFSLSNHFVPGENLKTFCGSPTYAAPELILKQEYRGPEVDIWSLGVVLYYFVCGRLPFVGHDFNSLFHAILRCEYTVPEHLSADCQSLLQRMLVVDPNQRATLDELFKHPWVDDFVQTELSEEERANISYENNYYTNTISHSVPSSPTTLRDRSIDESIVRIMESLGYHRSEIFTSIMSNKYNATASTYLLLRRKFEKENARNKRRHSFSNQPRQTEVYNLDVLDFRRHRRNRTMDGPVRHYFEVSPRTYDNVDEMIDLNNPESEPKLKSVFANGKKSVSFVFNPEEKNSEESPLVIPYIPPTVVPEYSSSSTIDESSNGSDSDVGNSTAKGVLGWLFSNPSSSNLLKAQESRLPQER